MIHPHVQLVLPAGIDGAIVKPMEWRQWNDSKSFTNDWLFFIAPIKAYRRARMAVRLAHWELEKDFMRKWWFQLSRYERDRWIGRRVDGEFSNIMLAAGFKGPKYQRGNFSLFPAGMLAAAGAAGTLSLVSANNSAINIDFSPPGFLEASYYCQDNGELYRISSSGTQHSTLFDDDWITSNPTADVGDDYEVKWNYISGNLSRLTGGSTNYSEDTWTQINLERRVGQDTDLSSTPSTFELDIGDNGASTSDVNQDYTVEAGNLV